MIYLASAYTHEKALIRELRYDTVMEVTANLLNSGRYVFSPIVYCHPLAICHEMPTDFAFWQSFNFDWIARCEKFYILDTEGWPTSIGVRGEYEYAKSQGKEIRLLDPNTLFVSEFQWPE